jgi:hypothetical protein
MQKALAVLFFSCLAANMHAQAEKYSDTMLYYHQNAQYASLEKGQISDFLVAKIVKFDIE